jgi:tetratricopeptide (TPR) repeat protein
MGDEVAARGLLDDLIPNYRKFLAERVPNDVVHHTWIGRLAWQCGRFDLAVELEESALASGLVRAGSYDFILGEMTRALALSSLRRWDEARTTIDHLWQSRVGRETVGEQEAFGDLDLRLRELRAALLLHDGKRREAVELQRETRDLWVAREGPKSPFVINATTVLALDLASFEEFAEAKREAQRAVDLARELLPTTAARRLLAESVLAESTAKAGDPEGAIPQLREAIAARESAGLPESIDVVDARSRLADILSLAKRFSEAEAEARQALAASKRLDPNNRNRIGTLTFIMGNAIQNQSRPAEAEPLLAEVAAKYREDFPDTPWRSARVDIYHARALRDLGRFEEAESKLLAALPVMTAEFGASGARTRDVLSGLVVLYMKWKKPEAERMYRDLLKEAQSATSRPAK